MPLRITVFLAVLLLSLPAAAQELRLGLFGGPQHKVYLGCLTCAPRDIDSVCNPFGMAGSLDSITSIWNEHGPYGSAFSLESPWNKAATDGPMVYDAQGRLYGFFSANPAHVNRVKTPALLKLLDESGQTADLHALRNLYCGA
jgi:hypothetical protein